MKFNISRVKKVKVNVLGEPPAPPEGSDFDFLINGTFYGLGTPVNNSDPTYCLSQNFIHTRNPITQIAISVVKTLPAPELPLIIGLVPGSIVGTPDFFNLANWHGYGTLDQSKLPEYYTPYWVSMPTNVDAGNDPICIGIVTNQTDTRWFVSIIDGGNPYLNLYRYCQNSTACTDGWHDFSPFDIACAVYSTSAPPTPCSDYTTQAECEPAGCLWWNQACHSVNPTTCDELNNQFDCERWGCFWYDGSCHSTPQQTDPIIYEFLSCDATNYEHCWDYGDEGNCESDPMCKWQSSWPGCSGRTEWDWHPPAKTTFQYGEIVWIYGRFDCDYPKSWNCGKWNGKYVKYELWKEGGTTPARTITWGPLSNYASYSFVWWLYNWSAGNYAIRAYWGDTSSCPNYLGTMTFNILAPPCEEIFNPADCETAGCIWWNNSCHSSNPETCEELNNVLDCQEYGCYWFQDMDPPNEWRCHSTCYWWDNKCHERAPLCNEILNSTDCDAWGCYWWDGTCHSTPEPIPCEDYNTQQECEQNSCYWYDGSCHSSPQPPCIPATVENGRFDVNNDGEITWEDALEIWNNRSSEVPYNPYYDMNCDRQVNFQDAGLCWINRTVEPICEEITDQYACLNFAGCFWYNGSCHSADQPKICYWIDSKGGPTGVTSLNIFELITAFLDNTVIPGYDFIPTSLEIFGVILYYMGDISQGDNNTGCAYS